MYRRSIHRRHRATGCGGGGRGRSDSVKGRKKGRAWSRVLEKLVLFT
jgi:hypothetical protein